MLFVLQMQSVVLFQQARTLRNKVIQKYFANLTLQLTLVAMFRRMLVVWVHIGFRNPDPNVHSIVDI